MATEINIRGTEHMATDLHYGAASQLRPGRYHNAPGAAVYAISQRRTTAFSIGRPRT